MDPIPLQIYEFPHTFLREKMVTSSCPLNESQTQKESPQIVEADIGIRASGQDPQPQPIVSQHRQYSADWPSSAAVIWQLLTPHRPSEGDAGAKRQQGMPTTPSPKQPLHNDVPSPLSGSFAKLRHSGESRNPQGLGKRGSDYQCVGPKRWRGFCKGFLRGKGLGCGGPGGQALLTETRRWQGSNGAL